MLDKRIEERRAESIANEKLTAHKYFAVYLYRIFTNAPLYLQWKRLLSYVRKFRTVAFILRVIGILVTVLETGALVILTTVVFLVLLPITAALMLGILVTARIDSMRANQKMKAALAGKKTYLLFLSRDPSKFLFANAKSLAKDGNAVVLVSPYWISPKGICKGRFYFTVRKERENLYLIRRYYFFSLRKRVLREEDTVIVY